MRDGLIGGGCAVSCSLVGRNGGAPSTLACLVRRGDEHFLLGAGHAFTRGFSASDTELHPLDSPCETIAILADAAPATSRDLAPEDAPRADAAIARIVVPLSRFTCEVRNIGLVASGGASVTPGDSVRKFGAASGLTHGRIIASGCFVFTEAGWLRDQILVRPDARSFSEGGDSGALVVDAQNHPIGIVRGGTGAAYDGQRKRIDGHFSVLSPMAPILDTFRVEVLRSK